MNHNPNYLWLGKCYLCGISENLDEEHLISQKGIYTIDNPIVLSACKPHNGEYKSKLDEVVGFWLNSTGSSEESKTNFQSKIDSLRKLKGNKQDKFKIRKIEDFHKKVIKLNIVGEDGVEKEGFGIVEDLNRINEFMRILLKGLMTFIYKMTFNWDNYFVGSYYVPSVAVGEIHPKIKFLTTHGFERFKQASTTRIKWPGIFEFCHLSETKGYDEFLVIFFQEHFIFGHVVEKDSELGAKYKSEVGDKVFSEQFGLN